MQLEVIYSIAQICELGLVMKTLSKLLKDKSKRIDRLLRTQTLNKEPKEIYMYVYRIVYLWYGCVRAYVIRTSSMYMYDGNNSMQYSVHGVMYLWI